jgi:hypothetical protein
VEARGERVAAIARNWWLSLDFHQESSAPEADQRVITILSQNGNSASALSPDKPWK